MFMLIGRGDHGPGRAGSGRAKTFKIHKKGWPEPGPARLIFLRLDPARPDYTILGPGPARPIKQFFLKKNAY